MPARTLEDARCPVCATDAPGTVAYAFGAARLRCADCSAWLVPHEGGLREEDPLLVPCLRAADAAVQTLDSNATLSRRRRFFVERGLRGSAVEDALAMLAAAMPIPASDPPADWLRFVETRRPGGYRDAPQSARTLHVRRPGLARELGTTLALSAYMGVFFYEHAPWGPLLGTLIPLALLAARLKTTRWTLTPERWTIPGRVLGRSVSLDPRTIEWIDVTRARLKDGVEVFGLTLRADGVEHVLAHPSPQLSEETAHGLARVLEEHAGLVPRRLSSRVRVEVEHDAEPEPVAVSTDATEKQRGGEH